MVTGSKIIYIMKGNKKPHIYPGGIRKQVPEKDRKLGIFKQVLYDNLNPPKEGKKNLTGKPEWCVVPMEAMEGVVRVFEGGAEVYGGGRTWLPGIRFSKLFSAICRHLFDWFYLGKNWDEKSGQHPLCHVIANCLMLLTFIDNKRFDDRRISDDYTKEN